MAAITPSVIGRSPPTGIRTNPHPRESPPTGTPPHGRWKVLPAHPAAGSSLIRPPRRIAAAWIALRQSRDAAQFEDQQQRPPMMGGAAAPWRSRTAGRQRPHRRRQARPTAPLLILLRSGIPSGPSRYTHAQSGPSKSRSVRGTSWRDPVHDEDVLRADFEEHTPVADAKPVVAGSTGQSLHVAGREPLDCCEDPLPVRTRQTTQRLRGHRPQVELSWHSGRLGPKLLEANPRLGATLLDGNDVFGGHRLIIRRRCLQDRPQRVPGTLQHHCRGLDRLLGQLVHKTMEVSAGHHVFSVPPPLPKARARGDRCTA